jgi:hypothetical protein
MAAQMLTSATIVVPASLLLLAVAGSGRRASPRTALGWIVIAGIATAAYVMCDAQGVRRAGSPWAYGCVVSITNALAMSWRQGLGFATRPWRMIGSEAAAAVPIGIAAATSYLLILWVWNGAPIAPAAALRDTSAVFAILIAVAWLEEPFTPLRLRFA